MARARASVAGSEPSISAEPATLVPPPPEPEPASGVLSLACPICQRRLVEPGASSYSLYASNLVTLSSTASLCVRGFGRFHLPRPMSFLAPSGLCTDVLSAMFTCAAQLLENGSCSSGLITLINSQEPVFAGLWLRVRGTSASRASGSTCPTRVSLTLSLHLAPKTTWSRTLAGVAAAHSSELGNLPKSWRSSVCCNELVGFCRALPAGLSFALLVQLSSACLLCLSHARSRWLRYSCQI